MNIAPGLATEIGFFVFQAAMATCVMVLLFGITETIGMWLLSSWIFPVGPIASLLEETILRPSGLAVASIGETERTKYRVLPNHVCIFRRKWGLRFWRLGAPGLEMTGEVSWADGRLRTVGRYALGMPLTYAALMTAHATVFLMVVFNGHHTAAFPVIAWLLPGAIIIFSRSLAVKFFADYSREVRVALLGGPQDNTE